MLQDTILQDIFSVQERFINQGKQTIKYYALVNNATNRTTTCSPSLLPFVIKMVEDVYTTKTFTNKYGMVGLKILDLFDYKKYQKDALEEIKKYYPRSKYIKPRDYNNILRERARVIAVNLAIREELKTQEEKDRESKYIQVRFKEDSPTMKLYKEIYKGQERINQL